MGRANVERTLRLLPWLTVGVPVADVVLDVLLFRRYPPFAVALYLLVALLAGLVVLRYAGPITLVRAAKRLQAGETPGRELVDGLLLVAGGLYLLFPGPVSDLLAVFLVTPFLRRLPRFFVARALARRMPRETTVEVESYRIE